LVETGAGPSVIEVPVSTWSLCGASLPVGGGGYFRLLPGALTRAACASIERAGRPLCIYLHPWEFDPGQPRIAAPWSKRTRHYLNLSRTLPRLDALLKRFRFASLAEVLREQGRLD
jgi:hypothetical protein